MITTEQAGRIIDVALDEAARRGFQPLCVVVLDQGGNLLALKRDHRASIGRPNVAIAKASGCLAMGFGGQEAARRAASVPAFYAALNGVLPHGILPVPGGVLVRDASGALIGAVGISGDIGENDEICALAGIVAAGLQAETGA